MAFTSRSFGKRGFIFPEQWGRGRWRFCYFLHIFFFNLAPCSYGLFRAFELERKKLLRIYQGKELRDMARVDWFVCICQYYL